jgi:hypothetical protein
MPALVPMLLVVLTVGGCKSRRPAVNTPTGGPPSTPAADTTGATASAPSGPVSYGPGPRPVDPHSLSDAELRYGVSPTKGDAVTYQDNVVIMEHGAQAIHSVSPDGTTWTLDASAPQVADLQPGKVMFASSRAVGRVLAVQRTGNEVSVVIGPVEITDVIKEADLSYNQPVDLQSMVAYSAPNYPGTTNELGKLTADARRGDSTSVTTVVLSPSGGVTPVAFASNHGESGRAREGWTHADAARFRELQQGPSLPSVPGIGSPGQTNIGDFQVIPFCCGGLGIKLLHNGDDIKVLAYAVLRFTKPSLQFNLKIHGGSVQTAKIVLNGASGLTVHIETATPKGIDGNINKTFFMPVDLSIPVAGMGVPFAVTLHQQLLIQTAFTAKNSTLNTTGDYSFSGNIFMGYDNGSWGAGAPTELHANSDLGEALTGMSLGATGMVFGMEGRVIVGIGAFGFVTGPFLGYSAFVGLTRGSDQVTALVGITCRGDILDLSLNMGIGYQMPAPVANAINAVLHALNLAPIKRSGGLSHNTPLLHKARDNPKGCAYKS